MDREMGYTFRPATAADEAFLYELHRVTMGAYVAQTWGEWDEGVQAAMFARSFDPVGRQIVVVAGRDVGAISAHRTADELFIGNIEILPAYQGRGLGTAIIGNLLAGSERDSVPARLQVLKVNPAQRLYRRLGFVPVGETPTHIRMSTRQGAADVARMASAVQSANALTVSTGVTYTDNGSQ